MYCPKSLIYQSNLYGRILLATMGRFVRCAINSTCIHTKAYSSLQVRSRNFYSCSFRATLLRGAFYANCRSFSVLSLQDTVHGWRTDLQDSIPIQDEANDRKLTAAECVKLKSDNVKYQRVFDAQLLRTARLKRLFLAAQSFIKFLIEKGQLNAGSIREAASVMYACYEDKPELLDLQTAERLSRRVSEESGRNSLLFVSLMETLACVGEASAAARLLDRELRRPASLVFKGNPVSVVAARLPVALAAFRNDDAQMGKAQLDAIDHPKSLSDPVLEAVLQYCERRLQSDSGSKEALALFSWLTALLQRLEHYPGLRTIEAVERLFATWNGKRLGARERLTFGRARVLDGSGRCKRCDQELMRVQLTTQEFDAVKNVVLALLGERKVYEASFPEEASRFQRFLECSGPFDLVVDGLNVFYGGMLERETLKKTSPNPHSARRSKAEQVIAQTCSGRWKSRTR